MNLLTNVTALGHYILKAYKRDAFLALDATLGNGYDTLELLRLGAKRVFAFDIQEEAFLSSKNLLLAEGCDLEKVSFIHDSHENLDKHLVHTKVDLALMNLGYLPNSSKEITTKAETTVIAIEKILKLLNSQGILLITIYYGHSEGEKEREKVKGLVSSLDSKVYHCCEISMVNQKKSPPEIIAITKKI